ncbi:MAG: heme ABC transporter ATP-binding protein [Rubellimicrobium sp.]|nr:heme ABC transporter ATP-binding protein [Rubellimicrobium sp.]
MIRLDGVSLHRGSRCILCGLSLDIRAGEVTVILGPNGSGKSTLLAALAGTMPYRGAVRLNGHDVSRCGPARMAEERAVLPQHSELAFPFRVAEVVALGARGGLAGDPAALAARVEALLARLGLEGFGPRNAASLSGGEAQRMHLARVLLQAETGSGAPPWLFLDEPVNGLDLAHQLAVMDEARAFARQGGGVLAVLHDLNLAVRAADRLLVLHEGGLCADGPPGRVLNDALLETVFGCEALMNRIPLDRPFLLVQAQANITRQ